MSYVSAIDQGTTSTRCIIFNHSGEIISLDQLEHKQIYPNPGWVEHNGLEIWDNTVKVIKNCLTRENIPSSKIVAIGITNQRETTILWNKISGKPIYNAIVWQDLRTDEICNRISKEFGQNQFMKKTGLPIATYFSAPKIVWLLDHINNLREQAENGEILFGNIDSWLIWNLTGGKSEGIHMTDVTNASRTMLMNLATLDWDDELLANLGIPKKILPIIKPSSHSYGLTTNSGPFGSKIPISGVLGDQQAATVGQACLSVGDVKNTYGTGNFMILNTGHKIIHSENGLLTTVCYKFGNNEPIYALEGSVAITGALVQWLRDNLGLIEKSNDIEELAQTVKDNGDIYFVPAFSGLFAPYWNHKARGAIVGMTRFINKGHIARAALEATAFQSRELLDAMRADSNVSFTNLKVDGGMVYNDLLMQFQSDILGIPVIRPKIAETTALGAAYAAGLAVGFWKNEEEILINWKAEKTWNPNLDERKRIELMRKWKKAVQKSFDWKD